MQLVHFDATGSALFGGDPLPNSIGYAEIVHRAYAGCDLSGLTRELVTRATGPVLDAAALLDLATVLQLQGGDLAIEGRLMQANALRLQRSFCIRHGTGLGPRILAFVTAGDFMTNTPIDFLLRGADAVLLLHFVDAQTTDLADAPAHDLAFMAIGEGPETLGVLQVMAGLLHDWPTPIFNNAATMIGGLSRDRVADLLAAEPSIYAPPTRRMMPRELIALAMGGEIEGLQFPLILRPIGSHAGAGLCLIADRAALVGWLRDAPCEVFAAPFVEYRDADGIYTKARVVQIAGAPYASHLAQSRHWMVHYLNADMTAHADRRAAEADWMAGFDDGFARRHAKAFAALHRIFGLDYFGIDCAEMPDGRLLVFEVDVAMIVHDMDDAAVFPYKKPAMQKLFAGFLAALSG